MAKLTLYNVELWVDDEDGETVGEYILNREELQDFYGALLSGLPQLDPTEPVARKVYENRGSPHGDPAKLFIRLHWDVRYVGDPGGPGGQAKT